MKYCIIKMMFQIDMNKYLSYNIQNVHNMKIFMGGTLPLSLGSSSDGHDMRVSYSS